MACEITKTGYDVKAADLLSLRAILDNIKANEQLMSNTIARKWSIKLEARLALSELPARTIRRSKEPRTSFLFDGSNQIFRGYPQ